MAAAVGSNWLISTSESGLLLQTVTSNYVKQLCKSVKSGSAGAPYKTTIAGVSVPNGFYSFNCSWCPLLLGLSLAAVFNFFLRSLVACCNPGLQISLSKLVVDIGYKNQEALFYRLSSLFC